MSDPDIDIDELTDEEIEEVIRTSAFQKSLKYRRLAQGIEVLEADDAIYNQLVATITQEHSSVNTRGSIEEALDLFVEEVKTYTEGMDIADDEHDGDLDDIFVEEGEA
jgi:ornithine carbamoyltransferase